MKFIDADDGEKMLEIFSRIGVKATVYRADNAYGEEVGRVTVPAFQFNFIHRNPEPEPEPTPAQKAIEAMKEKARHRKA
jgi:hypothetical protein